MMPEALVEHKGKYYVTDMRGNRILAFDRHGKLERTIGVVGSGPSELLRPGKLAVSRDGLIYVQEGGNERIQIMTLEGKHIGHFPVSYFQGLAVNSKGEVFLGQPERGKLVSVYSRQGQLVRAFGDLRMVSDFYGQAHAAKNNQYRTLINRVDIHIDGSDNVYVTFEFAPVLQKYDPTGRLVWEARLHGPDIDNLVTLFLTDESHRKFVRVGRDGMHANVVLLNSVVNPRDGNIYVLLPNKVIYVLDGQGRQLYSIDLQPSDAKVKDFWPMRISIAEGGEIFSIHPLLGCVRLEIVVQ